MKNKFWFVGVGLSLTVLAVYVLAAGSITTQSGDITLNPASGKVFVNGSLGVGTTNPAADLEISSSNNSKRKQLRLSQNGNLGIELITSSGGFTNWRIGAQNLVSNAFEITPSTAAGGTNFTTPAVTILSSGNVGVGTTNPSGKLGVSVSSGELYITNSSVYTSAPTIRSSSGHINFNDRIWVGGGNLLTFTAPTNPGNGNHFNLWTTDIYSAISTRSSSYPLALQTNGGNVGVGTTNPSYKMHLYDSNHIAHMVEANGNKEATLYLKNDYGRWGIIVNDDWSGPLQFYRTAGTQGSSGYMMTIDKDGKVGVGTTSPVEKLDVDGNIKASGKIKLRRPDGNYACCGPDNNNQLVCGSC